MYRTRITRAVAATRARVAVAITVLALSVGATATDVHAAPIDQPLISAVGIDFGANLVAGAPLNGGVLDWHQVAGSPIDPQLTGTLFLQRPAGVNAHVEIKYYTATTLAGHGSLLGTRVGPNKTATAAATDQFAINLGGFSNANIAHVHIELWDDSSGTMALRGTAIEDL
jgi:hypothetical protein